MLSGFLNQGSRESRSVVSCFALNCKIGKLDHMEFFVGDSGQTSYYSRRSRIFVVCNKVLSNTRRLLTVRM